MDAYVSRRVVRIFVSMLLLLNIVLVSKANAVTDLTSGLPWTFLGPQPILQEQADFGGFNSMPGSSFSATGRITARAFDLNIQNTLYVGTAGNGLSKSTDGGSTFSRINPPGSNSYAIGSITIDSSLATSVVYVGTGEANFSGDSVYGDGPL
jgi:hypothetical protein